MKHLSSQYIDDEMTLQEKQTFITSIRKDEQFYIITRDLIEQEQVLRSHLSALKPKLRGLQISKAKPIGYALACSVLVVLGYLLNIHSPETIAPPLVSSRFVIYQPEAHQVELAGSFNGWKKIPLTPIGSSGYWEARIPLSSGEYRFAYILNGDKKIADPTVPGREQDDFGGVNSILHIEIPI